MRHDLGAGVVGEVERGVQHAGDAQVVDVAAVAEGQLRRLVLRAPAADAARAPPGSAPCPVATASMASSTFT